LVITAACRKVGPQKQSIVSYQYLTKSTYFSFFHVLKGEHVFAYKKISLQSEMKPNEISFASLLSYQARNRLILVHIKIFVSLQLKLFSAHIFSLQKCLVSRHIFFTSKKVL
jgi:hypothetical protein